MQSTYLVFSSLSLISLDKIKDIDVEPREAWRAFVDILDFTAEIVSAISVLSFIFQRDHSSGGGHLFAMLCIAKPFIEMATMRDLFSKGAVFEESTKELMEFNL
jgi:hypothetical protein